MQLLLLANPDGNIFLKVHPQPKPPTNSSSYERDAQTGVRLLRLGESDYSIRISLGVELFGKLNQCLIHGGQIKRNGFNEDLYRLSQSTYLAHIALFLSGDGFTF